MKIQTRTMSVKIGNRISVGWIQLEMAFLKSQRGSQSHEEGGKNCRSGHAGFEVQ